MRPDAIIFDLDGTLADTLAGIAASMNQTLADFGYPTHPTDAYRRFVGDGIHKLIERALPPPPETDAQERERFLEAYLPRLSARGEAMNKPYPGITDMLDGLAARGLRLAVLSNKPHDATVACVDDLFGLDRFTLVRGHVESVPLKPDPGSVQPMLEELDVEAGRTFYVGDSNVDMDLANAAGMIGIGAAWGLRGRAELEAHGATHVIDHPMELVPLIES